LDFFSGLDNPFNAPAKDKYEAIDKYLRDKYLREKYPNEYDTLIKELEDKYYIKKLPNEKYYKLTRSGQSFVDSGGFIKRYNDEERINFFDIVKISAGIAASYYFIEILITIYHLLVCNK
jgi:hypothetical protein